MTPPKSDQDNRFHYRLCGARLASAIQLPELAGTEIPAQGEVDITFSLGDVPEIANPTFELGGIRMDGIQRLQWTVPGYGRYYIADGNQIVMAPEPGADEVALRTMLMGPMQAPLWYQRGQLAIHGAAVMGPRGGVLFAGPTGTGKSVAAALLLERGWPLLSDDMCVLDRLGGPVHLLPGYAGLRLWDSVASDISGIDAGACAHVDGGKHIVRARHEAPLPSKVRIAEFVMLDLRGPRFALSQCSEVEFLQRWDRHIHLPPLVKATGMMRQVVEQMHDLFAQGTRVWRVSFPNDLASARRSLDELLERLAPDS